LVLLGLAACQPKEPPQPAATAPALETDIARASYGLGFNIAGNVHNQYGEAIEREAFQAGLDDGFKGVPMRVTEQQVLAGLNALNAARETTRKAAGADNQAAAATFLAENGKRDGVVTLPSGLQYEIVTEGTGPIPKATDQVVTHYQGTLPDGTVFDSSIQRGEPATFPVNGVIKGWVEALQLMPVGSKWKLYIPPELAYGERGAGGRIGPNQALVFEVELLDILPAEGG
jgi:FKBP-type peptidyl-prolyl cis-trans isomerase